MLEWPDSVAAMPGSDDFSTIGDAWGSLDDALTVLDGEDEVRWARLAERRAPAVRALGRFDECVAILDQVVEVYAASGLDDEAAALRAELGYLHVWLNRFAEAFASYTRGLEILGQQRTASRSQLLALHGAMLGLAGLHEDGAVLLQEAEDIARSIGDDRALGRVLWGRAMAEWSNGRPREAIDSGRAAVAALRATGDLWSLVDALAWTSYPLLLSARPECIEEGERLAVEGMELGRRLGHRGGAVLCLRGVNLGRVLGGDLDTFEAASRDDLEGFVSIESPWVSQSHLFLALLACSGVSWTRRWTTCGRRPSSSRPRRGRAPVRATSC